MRKTLLNTAIAALVILPFSLAVAPIALVEHTLLRILLIALAPVTFIAAYCGICIFFAQLTKRAIVAGKFPRDIDHPVYGPRRIYGTMWTAIYYFKPLYWLLLTNVTTKTWLFRGFGYRGPIDMTTYPDTWIRDLPLLQLGEGSYLANRATLGTNLVLSDGNIMVDAIHVGKKSVVGHLCIIGIGTKIGEMTEIGLSSATGVRPIIGSRVNVGPRCDLNHGCLIYDGVKIGASSFIGAKAQILGEKIDIPAHTNIPAGSVIQTQTDVAICITKETARLMQMKDELLELVKEVQYDPRKVS